jgi:uncharacterized pyridoxamine 5'-phosphate oxidase family protein
MSTIHEVYQFLHGKTFYLATVEGNSPKVRPFGFVMEFEGKLYFATNDQKPSFRQLSENPRIEISTTAQDGKEWIRLSGKAVFDQRPEVKNRAFETAPPLKQMYGSPESPALQLFYIADGTAVFQTLGSQTTRSAAL